MLEVPLRFHIVFLIALLLVSCQDAEITDTFYLDDNVSVEVELVVASSDYWDSEFVKELTLKNHQTGAVKSITMRSIEEPLYFFLHVSDSVKEIGIIDVYLGQNLYDYDSFEALDSVDCFQSSDIRVCHGFNESGLNQFGIPTYVWPADAKAMPK